MPSMEIQLIIEGVILSKHY